MALIKCPECGKEISHKASVCISCGYPLKSEQTSFLNSSNTSSQLDYKPHLVNIKLLSVEKKKEVAAIAAIRKYTGLSLSEIRKMINNTPSIIIKDFPKNYALEIVSELESSGIALQIIDNDEVIKKTVEYIPKCPTCGSENIVEISKTSKFASAITFGLFSKTSRCQFKCSKCGYMW